MQFVRPLCWLALAGSLLGPHESRAAQLDNLFFAVDTTAHWPGSLAPEDASSGSLSLAQLRPVVHEAAFLYGVGTRILHGDVIMRLGYRFATGAFPRGSRIGSADVTFYSLSAVPIAVGWQMTLLDTPVRPVMDVEAGGSIASVGFDQLVEPRVESGWKWCWALRAGVGAHADVWEWVGVRLMVGGEWSRELWMERGPALSMSHVGLTLAVVARPPVKAAAEKPAPADKELIREYTPVQSAGRMNDAFAAIREGDLSMRRRDFIAAEASYRKGVGLLPRDSETQKNVEVPVRADWAKALIEVGRAPDAAEVITEALRIDPASTRAAAVVDELQRRGVTVTRPAAEPAAREPLY
jgi:hypothetical protein